MTNYVAITKYMCTVETKNYPVLTITPQIQRYCSIRKKLNASEIANCLAAYATVTLHKNTGDNVKLTRDNFKTVLIQYKNELLVQQVKKYSDEETKKNADTIEEMKKEEPVIEEETKKEKEEIEISETESHEEIQEDPEDPDFENVYKTREESNE